MVVFFILFFGTWQRVESRRVAPKGLDVTTVVSWLMPLELIGDFRVLLNTVDALRFIYAKCLA